MTDEAEIIVNGVRLDPGQSMTIRVALESFSSELAHDGLGDDKHGRQMTKAYLARIAEIRKALYPAAPPGPEET